MSLYLARDQRSNEVAALQNALNAALEPPKPLVLDGIFGPLTDAAVHSFQKREGLKVDGIAGPQTLDALFRGVEATARIRVTATKRGRNAASVQSPYSMPFVRPPAPEPSLGTVALLHREWLVRRWAAKDAPKEKLDLRPIPNLWHLFGRRPMQAPTGKGEPLSLSMRRPHAEKKLPPGSIA